MLTIISPCCRQNNIKYLYDSINFDKIDKWIIVYDTSKNRTYNKLYENHSKIMEVECDHEGVTGHPQRNYGMKLVNDGYMYFLDDDNIIHPQFWPIVDILDNEHFYTFDQIRDMNGSILHGNNISICNIDTAMFIIHKKHINNIIWKPNDYAADGYFICDIKTNNKDAHKYINSSGCYYNYLKWNIIGKHTYQHTPIIRHWENKDAKLIIGNFCSIATNVHIYLGGNHRSDWVSTYPFGHMNKEVFNKYNGDGHPETKGDVIIGNDVWIGANVTIMSGVTIGDGVVIANNSHVVKKAEPYSIIGGNPAKLIKYRFTTEQISKLLEIKWWNWDDSKINEYSPLLCNTDINQFINAAQNR